MKPIYVLLFSLISAVAGCSSDGSAEKVASAEHPGKQIYTRYCFTCHQGGVAGSPVYGDREAWKPRISKGRDALYLTTLEGIPPGMPIKGLCMKCTEEELRDAVDYLLLSVADGNEDE